MAVTPPDRALDLARQLAERESFIKSLFEKSPVGLNLCTLDGLWLESNDAVLAMLGYTHAEADGGLTYWQLTPRRYDAQEQVQLESLRTTGRYGPYEKEFIRKDGTLVPVRLNGFLVERDGKQYIWSLIEDITREREAQRALEVERRKAIQASKLATLGEMAASIVHEISNPLLVIDAWASQLDKVFSSSDVQARRDAVQDIRGAVERTTAIIRNLRRFSRDAAVDPRGRVLLSTSVEHAVALCRIRLKHAGVALTVAVDAGLAVQKVAVELEQVLVNLVNNAADAVRAAAEREVHITSRAGPDWVELRVEDSGPGLPAELAERAFAPSSPPRSPGKAPAWGSASRAASPSGTAARSPGKPRRAAPSSCGCPGRPDEKRSPGATSQWGRGGFWG